MLRPWGRWRRLRRGWAVGGGDRGTLALSTWPPQSNTASASSNPSSPSPWADPGCPKQPEINAHDLGDLTSYAGRRHCWAWPTHFADADSERWDRAPARTLLGVTPKACLNVRLKCPTLMKPQRKATSVTVSMRRGRGSSREQAFR